MFPIRDHNPSDTRPVVTIGLIVANVLVFLSYQPLATDPASLRIFFETWGIVPRRVTLGEGYATLVSSMFLHGGVLHLVGNMLFLWIFGDNLEDTMGHVGFLAFYVAAGLAAGALQIATDPGSVVPVVGASGAIAGVMGGYLLLYPKARVDVLLILLVFIRVFSVPAWIMLGLWFGFQLVGGASSNAAGGGVAYWAHAGGFVAGVVLCLPVWLRLGGPAVWADGRPPHAEARYAFVRTRIPRTGRRRRRGPWG